MQGDEVNKQREIIERIRKEEFGIDVDLQGDARTIVDNMTRKYRSLLATVAEDLNSKESHFILELIQNADDNNYHDGVSPSLAFRLERDCLVVVNNESGFVEANVKALCSAGESSKKNKKGYIGEKGIGFKSIFKVTDTPEVHSNGFHFLFNRTDPKDLLGYVVPHWREPSFVMDEQVTTLVMPAKPGNSFTQKTLVDVSDTLLLFLGKLRQLEVVCPDRRERYERRDSGAVTTLATERFGERPVRQNYLRKTVEIDSSDIVEPKREGVATTEMVLAFPLSEGGEAAPAPGCPTYAFLPIRDFGFNFYIQADFVLISSREGIHEDLPWNIRLRDGIAGAFAAALHDFKQRPALAMTYLKYLPTTDQVHDPFFTPVVSKIIDELRRTECIPVMGGGWKKPDDVLIAPEKIRELFPSEHALAQFGADYPVESFHIPSELKSSLGLRHLLVADVVAVFNKHAGWFQNTSTEWKAKFYAYLATSATKTDFIKQMHRVACIPIEGGCMAVPESEPVFFPLSAVKKYGFEHELLILDGKLLQMAVALSESVTSFFVELNVRYDDPYELIQSHVLNFHAGDKWTEAEDAVLIGHVRYIKDKFNEYLHSAAAKGQQETEAIRVLKDGLMIGTKQEEGSWIFARAHELYLGSEYLADFDIEALLGDDAPMGRIVTSKYIENPRKGEDPDVLARRCANWREFFIKIGINVSPLVERQANGDVEFSEELERLLRSDSSSVRRKTLESMDRQWSSYSSALTYQSGFGRNLKTYWTTFITNLKGVIAPTKRKTSAPLESAYLDNEGTRGVLGDSVVYVDAALNNPAFLEVCGITYKVDAQACLKRLQQIKSDRVGGIEQLRKIYRHLERVWDKEKALIDSAFGNDALIRVGRGDSARWVLPSEACWNQTNIDFLDSRYPALSGPYKEHFTFFTKMLRVPQELALENWVDAIEELEELDEANRADVAVAIYRRLSRAVERHNRDGAPSIDWIFKFDDCSLLLDQRGNMVEKFEHVYADDRPGYSAMFSDVEQISFLAVSAERLPGVRSLLKELEIQNVSDVMTIEVLEDLDGRADEALSQKLREMLIPIARIVYSQGHDRFEEAVDEGLFNQLSHATVVEVDELVQTVSLAEWRRETTGQSAHRGNVIFLDMSASSKVDHVAIEVEKMLGLRKGTSDAISRLLMSSTTEDAASYLLVRQTPELPAEELEKLLGFVERTAAPEPIDEDLNNESAFEDGTEIVPDAANVDVTQRMDRLTAMTRGNSHPVPPERTGTEPSAGVGGAGQTIPNTNSGAITEPPRLPSRLAQSDEETQVARQGKPSTHKLGTNTGRLLSYVEPKEDVNEQGESIERPSTSEHNRAVEQAAVRFFREAVSGRWKNVVEMPPNNPGFDFKSVAMDGNEEVIEIKGQSGAWTEEGIALTPTELLAASSWKDRYWLCVVEFALDESRRRLWLIRNPFGKANQFRFDLGWRAVAERDEGSLQRPRVGLFVDVPEKGRGTILAVQGSAILTRITIGFPETIPISLTFNPATMKLSEA
jgi:hypothetical protein